MLLGLLRLVWFLFLSLKKFQISQGLCAEGPFPWYLPVPIGCPYHGTGSCPGRSIHCGMGREVLGCRKNRLLPWWEWGFSRELCCPWLCLGGNRADAIVLRSKALPIVCNSTSIEPEPVLLLRIHRKKGLPKEPEFWPGYEGRLGTGVRFCCCYC